ncbi:hypothetical protein BH11MYX1_BH11MYX1_15750 [soil metagenome]
MSHLTHWHWDGHLPAPVELADGIALAELSPAHWRYLTRIDGIHHVAVIAFRDGEVAGVARMIRLDQHRAAEISVLVDDDLQRKRVGSLLRDVLFVLARSRAYRTLSRTCFQTRSGSGSSSRGRRPPIVATCSSSLCRALPAG